MQELDKKEIYLLEGLSEEQLRELSEKCDFRCVNSFKKAEYIRFYNYWMYGYFPSDFIDKKDITAKAIDLFKQEIKKGQIWEHIKTGERVEVESIDSVNEYITTSCGSTGSFYGLLNHWELVEDHNEIVYKTEFKTITDSIASLLEYKNEKYGNAALEPLNIFTNKTQVGQRIDDKLARIKNSDELRKNDVADLIGYLLLECKFRGWNNFDEFKD